MEMAHKWTSELRKQLILMKGSPSLNARILQLLSREDLLSYNEIQLEQMCEESYNKGLW